MFSIIDLFGKRFAPVIRDGGKKQILFIHGLGGSGGGTWGKFFQLISSDADLYSFSADCYTFPTSLTQIFSFERRPGVRELADGLRTYIEFHHPACTNLYLVAHSLGGLVVRQFLLDALGSPLEKKINGALLYAVPNSGSALAQVSNSLSWHHIQARQLIPNSDFLAGLNREWTRRAVESHFDIEYVVGGLDQIVPLESSAWSQSGKIHTIIGAGHRDIVKPGSAAQTAFKILKSFLQADTVASSCSPVPVAPTTLQKAAVEAASVMKGDPLFMGYTPACETFYLLRKADSAVVDAVTNSHVWVSGPAGLGKTVSLQRAMSQLEGKVLHLMLSGHGNVGPTRLIAAILTGIYESFGFTEKIVLSGEVQDFCEHIKNISNILSDGTLTVLIEEIPIGPDEFPEFLTIIYHMLVTSGTDGRIRWLFSSIPHPPTVLPEGKAHLLEKVQFLRFAPWSKAEITSLVSMLIDSGVVSLNRSEKKVLIENSGGSPRIVKMAMRRRRFVTEEKIPMAELISSVKTDLGQ